MLKKRESNRIARLTSSLALALLFQSQTFLLIVFKQEAGRLIMYPALDFILLNHIHVSKNSLHTHLSLYLL